MATSGEAELTEAQITTIIRLAQPLSRADCLLALPMLVDVLAQRRLIDDVRQALCAAWSGLVP